MHVGRAVARPRETVADADEGAFRFGVCRRQRFDFTHVDPGDLGRPFRRLLRDMPGQFVRRVCIFTHIVPIGVTVAEEHVDHRRRQCAVRAGPRHQVNIGCLRGRCAVRIDHHQLSAALLSCARNMGHDVDLGMDGIAAPDDDQVALRHLAPVDAILHPDPRQPAGIGDCVADRAVLPGIAERVAEPVETVALQQPHRAGVMIGKYGLAPVTRRRSLESACNDVERVFPSNRLEGLPSDALIANPPQRLRQAVRVMHPLGIARDLGADDPGRIAIVGSAPNPADALRVEPLHLQGAGGRAVVRTCRMDDIKRHRRFSLQIRAEFTATSNPSQSEVHRRAITL